MSEEPEFGFVYQCWRDGVYIGEATFTDDPVIGGNFLSQSVNPNGLLISTVYLPDSWVKVKSE